MIYHSHPDNVLAFCSREMLRPLGIIEEKSQKRLERQECIKDRDDSKASTLPWLRRLKKLAMSYVFSVYGWRNVAK